VARSLSFAGTSRFRLIRLLGAGGMGVVYEAQDRERNVRVALKTLRSLSGDSLLRFKQEFREFQNLRHEHLVQMHELFFDEGEWFFTMELLAGIDFISWVRPRPDDDPFPADVAPAANLETQPTVTAPGLRRRRGELDEARLRAALPQLVTGVVALHDAGKIHRDLKPSNVLVKADGRVVLLDFGLATEMLRQRDQAEKSSNDIVGTVEYMAPEQASGRVVGPEADWYALGVMLYEALTGQVPVTGHALEVMMAKQRIDAPSPLKVSPEAPRDLAELAARLLSFNPSARPGGKELLERLGRRPSGPRPALTRSSVAAANLFVGRETELAVLTEKAEEARHGTVALAITGESGIGKSALVRRFTEGLLRDDPQSVVLWGACYEAENVPFKAIDGLVDSLSAAMRKLAKADASSPCSCASRRWPRRRAPASRSSTRRKSAASCSPPSASCSAGSPTAAAWSW
jgi:serine/threonine protein kinase